MLKVALGVCLSMVLIGCASLTNFQPQAPPGYMESDYDGGRTTVRLQGPQGAAVSFYTLEAKRMDGTIPCKFTVRAGTYYLRIVLPGSSSSDTEPPTDVERRVYGVLEVPERGPISRRFGLDIRLFEDTLERVLDGDQVMLEPTSKQGLSTMYRLQLSNSQTLFGPSIRTVGGWEYYLDGLAYTRESLALGKKGQRNRRAGIVLSAVGGGVTAIGAILFVLAAGEDHGDWTYAVTNALGGLVCGTGVIVGGVGIGLMAGGNARIKRANEQILKVRDQYPILHPPQGLSLGPGKIGLTLTF